MPRNLPGPSSYSTTSPPSKPRCRSSTTTAAGHGGRIHPWGAFAPGSRSRRFGFRWGREFRVACDSTRSTGRNELRHLRIVRSGEADIPLPPQDVTAARQIASLEVIGDKIAVKTVDGATDPILSVAIGAPLLASMARQLVAKLPSFALWCVVWTLLIGAAGQAAKLALRLRIDEAPQRRQTAVVAAVALIATLLACLPIIFLHQSFLGPGNGNFPYFYSTCPFVVGTSDCRTEDIHGADTGAMALAFFPAVVVQQQAVTQFGEFPLWNRYNSSGITMVGQGQMMLGDPLNWLQWLVGVDALSLDIKFIFLRFVFAAALGLSVLTVTRALRPSVMVAFAAPFVGYFIYRVNHPAIFTLCYAPLISLAWLRLTYPTHPRGRFCGLPC